MKKISLTGNQTGVLQIHSQALFHWATEPMILLMWKLIYISRRRPWTSIGRHLFIIPLQDFVSAVREKVLSDMEHKPPTHEADKWMANLAIMSVHLKEGNTFVRSIWLHLVGKVSENLSRWLLKKFTAVVFQCYYILYQLLLLVARGQAWATRLPAGNIFSWFE